jgi:hypothetical protein
VNKQARSHSEATEEAEGDVVPRVLRLVPRLLDGHARLAQHVDEHLEAVGLERLLHHPPEPSEVETWRARCELHLRGVRRAEAELKLHLDIVLVPVRPQRRAHVLQDCADQRIGALLPLRLLFDAQLLLQGACLFSLSLHPRPPCVLHSYQRANLVAEGTHLLVVIEPWHGRRRRRVPSKLDHLIKVFFKSNNFF